MSPFGSGPISDAGPLLSYDDCRGADRLTIDQGFPETQLMGQAALASLYLLESDGYLSRSGRLILLCGSGNNGGDGFALAYMLLGKGPQWLNRILIFRTGPGKSEACRLYTRQLETLGVSFHEADDFPKIAAGPDDVIIEALLGTGQAFPPRDATRVILSHLTTLRAQESRPALIALDVPAGLREDQPTRFIAAGKPTAIPDRNDPKSPGAMFPVPDDIHSYGADKCALRLNADLAAGSRVRVLPMGFHPEAMRSSHGFSLMNNVFRPEAYRKGPTTHKYSAGHGALVGGSPTMEGAALLSSRSFFAAGGGILRTLVPTEDSRRFLTTAEPTVMFLDLESPDSLPRMEEILPTAIALGPGLAPEHLEFFLQALLKWLTGLAGKEKTPWVVLDAGALPLIAHGDYPDALRERTICTPHTGEWRRLLSIRAKASNAPMEDGDAGPNHVQGLLRARAINQNTFKCHMLIKDAVSVLLAPAADHGETVDWIFSRPSGNLAVAGSGDVLTGILLAVLSRSHDTSMPDAVQRALTLHAHAAAGSTNPEASRFPDLIRAAL